VGGGGCGPRDGDGGAVEDAQLVLVEEAPLVMPRRLPPPLPTIYVRLVWIGKFLVCMDE
jgi:hypothetical protein